MEIKQAGYFRNPLFDNIFVKLIPLLAIATAYIAHFNPDYLPQIIFLDFFFLGYHHVISTYTRLTSVNLTRSEFRFVVYQLPLIVLSCVFIIAYTDHAWLLPTIYLHWQWWHYTRQSEGISKAIKFKLKSFEAGSASLNRMMFYLMPASTFLMMSARQPESFIFMSVYTLPVNIVFAEYLLLITISIFIIWLVSQFKALKSGKLARSHFYYLISHHVIYFVSYVLIDNITIGWLAINVWHNAQYIAFVWHVNSNTFKQGTDKNNLVMSWISQPKFHRIFVYLSVCLVASYIFYSAVNQSITFIGQYTLLPLTVIAYQSINFHHYIVDTMIWKLRKPKMQANLGINSL